MMDDARNGILAFGRNWSEDVFAASVEMDDLLNTDVSMMTFSTDGPIIVPTCYGDLCKTINALMDYSRLMELVCVQWGLEGYHRASYELHAQKLRQIAHKLQTGLGYDYEAAVRKCRRRKAKRISDSVGEDALTLAALGKQADSHDQNLTLDTSQQKGADHHGK